MRAPNSWTCLAMIVALWANLPASLANETRVSETWTKIVEQNAPKRPRAAPRSDHPRKVLVFSLATGYKHTVRAYVDKVFQVLGRVSGTFQTTVSYDIESLEPANLDGFDVLVLNNTCPKGPRRNLFLDELETNPRYRSVRDASRQEKARALEQSILEFVHGGKGLVVIHGAPTLLNNSPEFTKMVGGAFDYHPPNQIVTVRTVDPSHPLVAAFRGQGPLVYRDEPYCFKGAYAEKAFTPLLAFDTDGVKDARKEFASDVRYAAWVKPYGKGRVVFSSPGHFPEIYESAAMLQFLLDITQYAAGDLKLAK